MTDAVRLEHVGYAFGDVRAVDDVTFAVEEGEMFGSSARTARGRPRRSG